MNFGQRNGTPFQHFLAAQEKRENKKIEEENRKKEQERYETRQKRLDKQDARADRAEGRKNVLHDLRVKEYQNKNKKDQQELSVEGIRRAGKLLPGMRNIPMERREEAWRTFSEQAKRDGVDLPVLQGFDDESITDALLYTGAAIDATKKEGKPTSVQKNVSEHMELMHGAGWRQNAALKKKAAKLMAQYAKIDHKGFVRNPDGSVSPVMGYNDALSDQKQAEQDGKNESDLYYKPRIKYGETAATRDATYEADKAQARPRIEASIRMKADKMDRLSREIAKAKQLSSGWSTGAGGWILKNLPATQANDLEGTLTTIKANMGFDELQAMRDASPTGGAVGQLSERELTYLQSLAVDLEQSRTQEMFERNLAILEEETQKSWQRVLEAYEQEYGEPYKGRVHKNAKPAGKKRKVYNPATGEFE